MEGRSAGGGHSPRGGLGANARSGSARRGPATCPSVAECREQIEYVTNHRHKPIASFNPAWSPNGRRIAYVKFRDRGRRRVPLGDIYSIAPDGSHRRAVSTSPRFEFRPDWGQQAP